MNVLVVDDHVLFREGLVSLLSSQPDFTIVGEAGTVRESVEMTLKLQPDLVLMDVSLPDGNGLDAVKSILSKNPEIKIVMLTIHEFEDFLLEAVRNGAIGYLLKNIPTTKLVKSLRALEQGEAALSRTMTGRIIKEFHRTGKVQTNTTDLEVLTAREMEVLELLGAGSTNQEIAEQLVISEATVKVHVHHVLKKLNLKNRHEAGKFARRQGLGPPSPKPPSP